LEAKISVKNINGGACFTIELPYSEYGEHYADTLPRDEKLSLERINQLSRKVIELEEVEKNLQKWADIFKQAHWGIAIHIGTSKPLNSPMKPSNTLYGLHP
jgi:vacuolar-type H+-ATPase subunit D/Vma8